MRGAGEYGPRHFMRRMTIQATIAGTPNTTARKTAPQIPPPSSYGSCRRMIPSGSQRRGGVGMRAFYSLDSVPGKA